MISNEVKNIIVKYLTNQASRNDLDRLSVWLKEPKNVILFQDFVKTSYAVNYNMKTYDVSKVKTHLIDVINEDKKKHRLVRLTRRAFKYSVAASIIFLISISYIFNRNKTHSIDFNNVTIGTDKAILTLANGVEVFLDSTTSYQDREITGTGKEIIYKPNTAISDVVEYNYLTIPRGGQYHVVLSDGTEVWLNSESQLKYPINFIEGRAREVELVYGEGYFEVSHSTEHHGDQFKLITGSQEIKVLGTEFNVKAYKDEDKILSTLVKGSVSINVENHNKILKPGEQSNFTTTTNDFNVYKVQVKNETSWRRGIFSFKNKPLKDIMVVLSRWYDVDVNISNNAIEDVQFTGVLSKKQSIIDILETIKITNDMNYSIQNKSLYIE